MYSDEITGILRKGGIEHGDYVVIESKSGNVEGILMPSTEANGPNSIIVKLDNGYNIGVNYSKGARLKKLSSRKPMSFPKAKADQKKGLPRITLIYTGGTIGSKIDYSTGGVHMLLDPGELLYEVPALSDIANIDVKKPFGDSKREGISSEDMTYLEWQKIAEEAAEALNAGSRGIVITMGTDTMHYAASALSFMLQGINAPVIITGSQRSSDRGSSDAFMNLTCAVALAARSDVAEVCICMHASSSDDRCALIRGTRARKMHTSRRDAFRAINDRPIAYISKDLEIAYANDYNKMEGKQKKITAQTKFEPKVALVKSHPNSDPEIIDFYAGKGYKGIIIEGTGLGHVPSSGLHQQYIWLEHVKNAVKKGIVVGVTSQCLNGRVNANVYRNLRLLSGLGAIYCEDMIPETAFTKLGWLLGNHSIADAKKLLDRSLAREIKERSRFEEFQDE